MGEGAEYGIQECRNEREKRGSDRQEVPILLDDKKMAASIAAIWRNAKRRSVLLTARGADMLRSLLSPNTHHKNAISHPQRGNASPLSTNGTLQLCCAGDAIGRFRSSAAKWIDHATPRDRRLRLVPLHRVHAAVQPRRRRCRPVGRRCTRRSRLARHVANGARADCRVRPTGRKLRRAARRLAGGDARTKSTV